MIEFYGIYPNSSGSWSFSLIPTIILDNDVEQGTRTAELIWLFWGIGMTRYL